MNCCRKLGYFGAFSQNMGLYFGVFNFGGCPTFSLAILAVYYLFSSYQVCHFVKDYWSIPVTFQRKSRNVDQNSPINCTFICGNFQIFHWLKDSSPLCWRINRYAGELLNTKVIHTCRSVYTRQGTATPGDVFSIVTVFSLSMYQELH